MKNRSEIWLSVLDDLGDTCSVSTHEDAQYVRDRVRDEGDTFFTVTLPQFGKDLEIALADGILSPDLFTGFRRRRLSIPVYLGLGAAGHAKPKKMPWGVPLFLSGFTRRLFLEPDVWYKQVRDGSIGDEGEIPHRTETYPYILHQPPSLLVSPSSDEQADEMADAIFAVRQLCSLFSKEKSDAPEAAATRAIESYVQVDAELDRPL